MPELQSKIERFGVLVWVWKGGKTHRFPPKGSVLEGKSPAISGKSRLVKYSNLAR